MEEYKVGDEVECIDDRDCLLGKIQKGARYKIGSISNPENNALRRIVIEGISYYPNRFRLSPPAPAKPQWSGRDSDGLTFTDRKMLMERMERQKAERAAEEARLKHAKEYAPKLADAENQIAQTAGFIELDAGSNYAKATGSR